MDDVLDFDLDPRLRSLLDAVAELAANQNSFFAKIGHIADLIEQAEEVLESPESFVREIRDEWAYFPSNVKEGLSELVRLMQEVSWHQKLLVRLTFRALLIIPSIRRQKNLYGIGKRFLFDVAVSIAKINEAWNELNAELSAISSYSIEANDSIFDEDQDDDYLKSLLSQPC